MRLGDVTRHRNGFVPIALALLLGSCSASPSSRPTDAGSSPASGASAAVDEATAFAIRFRTENGLRADLATIHAAATDRAATSEFGTPLFPAEVSELFARNERTDEVMKRIAGYLRDHDGELGGVWIDQAKGGIVTVSFTGPLAEHRVALARLAQGAGVVRVVEARYPQNELRALQERVAADDAWFRSIRAHLEGVGYDPTTNALEIDVSTAEPDIVSLVIARFRMPADAVRVVSDGTGIALEPWGRIDGRVERVPATVLGELTLNYHTDRAGADCGRGDVGIGIAADGTFDLPCQAGHWIIDAGRNISDIVARGEVDVVAGRRARMTLRPTAP
jgi:hypothetical protein